MRVSFLKIHPLTIFFLLLAFFTGYFKYVIYLMSLIFIHELGHMTAGVICNWKIRKVVLLPFGGMTYFEEKLNKPIKDELFIVLLGPIYQILFYYLLCVLGFKTELLTSIHCFLLLFNLLPIYPLDGSKIVLLLCEEVFSYYKSHIYITGISFFTLIVYLFLYKAFLYYIIFFFFIYQVICFYKRKNDIFFKFLLERYLYRFSFKKKKIIIDLKDMKRDCYHFLKKDKKLFNEDEFLKTYFKEI